ncbi:cytochrome P450 [Metarhizium album ARSEF 1941]|uniref:Cytochrome P450 n=1 Tax=Metarhizium album (strain ARSEF 1941) TaxID=1081103 RepID=A0A0B2X8K5_METAS|nr:cytochrome P450 [Metarhizium album ARSEF 1941]KHO02108.1 cytochrome P450 [Metarhizium album ARSEF 1941]
MEPHNLTMSASTHVVLNLVQANPAVAGLATTSILIISIILLFGGPASNHKHGITSPPSMPAYWLPFFAHAFQFFFNKDGFTAKLKKRYPEGIFSVTMLGKRHHVIHDPSIMINFWNRPSCSSGEKWTAARALTKSFGLRKQDQITYSNLAYETPDLFKHMLSEPGLSEFVDGIVDGVKAHIAEFVTFNSSVADQSDWERSARVDVVQNSKGEAFVEADLMSLVRNFVAKTANPALFGTDFVENFPEFWDLLWMLDDGFLSLATGVPAWVPWPKMQRAKVARRKLIARGREFEEAMDKYLDGEDPGSKWQDMDNVSTFVKSRIGVFRKGGLSVQARATCDVALAWAMNANANQLTSWLLFELYRDPVLLETVREEIAPFVKIVQPQNEFGSGVWIAPELEKLDMNGLINECPHLKAAYIETMRVYTSVWIVKWLGEDVVVEPRGKSRESYFLQKGHMAHIAHEMHQFDPKYFPNPKEWHHDRFLKDAKDTAGRNVQVVEMGTLRPFGAGPTMCKGRAIALREMLFYTAMIVSFYDMVPPEGQRWEEPGLSKRAVTKHPTKPIKVWIKRRDVKS